MPSSGISVNDGKRAETPQINAGVVSLEKWEKVPGDGKGDDNANWILVSMGDAKRLEYCLENFRKKGDVGMMEAQAACSSTLIWSGKKENNVPVSLFGDNRIGFAMDPQEIDVPHAEFRAYRTGSVVPQEVNKGGARLYNGYRTETENSKYSSKQGRIGSGMGHIFYTTNHAKWERLPGHQQGKQNEEGDIVTFAKAVWRKYFIKKKSEPYGGQGEMSLNEALVIQKGQKNPIAGIVIDVFKKDVKQVDIDRVKEVLQKRSDLRLYIYDRRQTEHIFRVAENAEAVELLNKGAASVNSEDEIQRLSPFKKVLPVDGVKTTLADQARKFIEEKKFLNNFGSIDFRDNQKLHERNSQLTALLFSWGGGTAIGARFAPSCISDYDKLKREFARVVIKNIGKEYPDQLKAYQIFNDVAREMMIAEIAKKNPEFAQIYQEKFNQLQLDKFLSPEEYNNAKNHMQCIINGGADNIIYLKKKFNFDVLHEVDNVTKGNPTNNYFITFLRKEVAASISALLAVNGIKGSRGNKVVMVIRRNGEQIIPLDGYTLEEGESFALVLTDQNVNVIREKEEAIAQGLKGIFATPAAAQRVPTSPTTPAASSPVKVNYSQLLNEAIHCYKLPYNNTIKEGQAYFNTQFDLDGGVAPSSRAEYEGYLLGKLGKVNETNKGEYFSAVQDVKQATYQRDRKTYPANTRGHHEGLHGMKVAYYSEIFLNLYRKYKDVLPTNLKQEIEQFNSRNQEELKFLAAMHDVARTRGGIDTAEYRNAFYAALLLEKYGYSKEGAAKLAADLANKGEGDDNYSGSPNLSKKSLMSKLIQSGDCAAITRIYPFDGTSNADRQKSAFDLKRLNLWRDFQGITDEVRKAEAMKEINSVMQAISDLEANGNMHHHLVIRGKDQKTGEQLESIRSSLEFSPDPLAKFAEYMSLHPKGQELTKLVGELEISPTLIPPSSLTNQPTN